jgi:diaminopimelate decarboxylase
MNLTERLAPGHTRDADGMLCIGGIRADALASSLQTPALLLDLSVLDASIREIEAACGPHRIGISYAGKALLVVPLARAMSSYAIGVDAASLGELLTAERGGFASERITLHGAGKSDEELDAALDGRAGRIVVDSIEELRRLVQRAGHRGVDILLRLNTGIEAHTHDFIRTAGDNSKFGLAPNDEPVAAEILRAAPNARMTGVHAHIGSQIFDAAPFVANAEALLRAARRWQSWGFPCGSIVAGGGFGVPMHPELPEEKLDFRATIAAIASVVPNDLRCEIEPGRAIIAAAGTSLYRVIAVKRYRRRTFVIVDGSMADNPRPALYGAYHHAVAARASDAPFHPVTLSGRSCENDELGDVALPADIQAGDLIAMCATGAYTYSMSSNYNRFPRPPVAAIENREVRPFVPRQSVEDVLRSG